MPKLLDRLPSFSERLPRLKDRLQNADGYVAWAKAVGDDRMRYRAIDALGLKRGDTVVDIGCGPAYYFPKYPQPITYEGFDERENLVSWARQHFGSDGATFTVGEFDDAAADRLGGTANGVLISGVLQQVDNAGATALLKRVGKALAPGASVAAVTPCLEIGQNRVSEAATRAEPGDYIRDVTEFEAIARLAFRQVTARTFSNRLRLPTFALLTLRDPIA